MKSKSIIFEISILYTAILGLVLILFSGILYFLSNALLQHVDRRLETKARAVEWAVNSYEGVLGKNYDSLVQAVGKTMAMTNENHPHRKTWKVSQKWVTMVKSLNLNQDYINFVGMDEKDVFSSPNLNRSMRSLFLENSQFPPRGQVIFWTLDLGFKNVRVVNYPFSDKEARQYLIQVGVPQDPFLQLLRNWLYSIAISVPLILLLTHFVGRVLADKILRPVYEITDLAKRITRQDLSTRIKTKYFSREMESLIVSFNDMIARLEQSFKHIEQFSNHAAHELKTPLTIIQGEANLLLRKDRPLQEYKKALRIIMEESERVLKTVDDLLLLTKLDYQQAEFKFEQLDFVEFFNEIVEQNRLRAAGKGIGIRMNFQNIHQPLMVNGDRVHLRRLFFDIIDQAIKFTPSGGCVDMHIENGQGKVESFISDTGPGMSEENLKKMFENFYRADKNTTGDGLGLHIAYSIARLHQGEIYVDSKLGRGTTFRVSLPSWN
jgi:signal transduction histidine kinase